MSVKKKVIIIGYSGHSYEPIEILLNAGYEIYGYFDKREIKKNYFNLVYLGYEKSSDFNSFVNNKNFCYFVSIGDNQIRTKITSFLRDNGCRLINVIHPSAQVSSSVKLGNGIFISKNVIVNSMTTIGDDVILNTSSLLEHDCIISKGCHISPGSVICGNVKIGNQCLIGANSVINPNINIGNNVVIGSGSVVVKNVSNSVTLFGNPAKIYEKK